MKRIYLDKRVWRDSRDNWVSFESDPKLRVTKTNIYGRCVPCITNLYQQLQEGKEEIESEGGLSLLEGSGSSEG